MLITFGCKLDSSRVSSDGPAAREAGTLAIGPGPATSRSSASGDGELKERTALQEPAKVKGVRGGVVVPMAGGNQDDEVIRQLAEFIAEEIGVDLDDNDTQGIVSPRTSQDPSTETVTSFRISISAENTGNSRICDEVQDLAEAMQQAALDSRNKVISNGVVEALEMARRGDCDRAQDLLIDLVAGDGGSR